MNNKTMGDYKINVTDYSTYELNCLVATVL